MHVEMELVGKSNQRHVKLYVISHSQHNGRLRNAARYPQLKNECLFVDHTDPERTRIHFQNRHNDISQRQIGAAPSCCCSNYHRYAIPDTCLSPLAVSSLPGTRKAAPFLCCGRWGARANGLQWQMSRTCMILHEVLESIQDSGQHCCGVVQKGGMCRACTCICIIGTQSH